LKVSGGTTMRGGRLRTGSSHLPYDPVVGHVVSHLGQA
jgi:hypothetical protein